MNKKTQYRFTLYLPEEVEDKAREKATKMGLVKGGKGNLSGYIRTLIIEDLHDGGPLDMDVEYINESTITNRVNLTFPEQLANDVSERAANLGFIRMVGGEIAGNITRYIIYLLNKNI